LRWIGLSVGCLLAGVAFAAAEQGFEVSWLGSGPLHEGPPPAPPGAPVENVRTALAAGAVRDLGQGDWWLLRPPVSEESGPLPRVLHFVGARTVLVNVWLPGRDGPEQRQRYLHSGSAWGNHSELPVLIPAETDLSQGIVLHVSGSDGRLLRPLLSDLDSYLEASTRNKLVIACSAAVMLLLALQALLLARSLPSSSYRWLTLMACTAAAYVLGLNAELWNLPGLRWLASLGGAAERFVASGLAIGSALFVMAYLDLRHRKRKARHLLGLIMLAYVVLVVHSLLLAPSPPRWGATLLNALVVLQVLVILWEALVARAAGLTSGRYLLWAWSPAMLLIVLWVLVLEGWWPGGPIDLSLVVAPALALQMLVLLLGVAQDSQRLRTERDLANEAAGQDALTGAMNRRALSQRMPSMIEQADRVGLVYLDLDRFKRINDEYGHAIGDACLQRLTARLQRALGEQDLLFRQGGEEFVVALPGLDLDQTAEQAEALRRAVSGRPFALEGLRLPLSISLGVTCWQAAEPLAVALERADRNLYRAKQLGRNRVMAE
jgi:diguanylate cyclase (GGDEF)-like protein